MSISNALPASDRALNIQSQGALENSKDHEAEIRMAVAKTMVILGYALVYVGAATAFAGLAGMPEDKSVNQEILKDLPLCVLLMIKNSNGKI